MEPRSPQRGGCDVAAAAAARPKSHPGRTCGWEGRGGLAEAVEDQPAAPPWEPKAQS